MATSVWKKQSYLLPLELLYSSSFGNEGSGGGYYRLTATLSTPPKPSRGWSMPRQQQSLQPQKPGGHNRIRLCISGMKVRAQRTHTERDTRAVRTVCQNILSTSTNLSQFGARFCSRGGIPDGRSTCPKCCNQATLARCQSRNLREKSVGTADPPHRVAVAASRSYLRLQKRRRICPL